MNWCQMKKSLEVLSEMSLLSGILKMWQRTVRSKNFASLVIVYHGKKEETMFGFGVDCTEVLEMMNGSPSSLEKVRNIWICGLLIISHFVQASLGKGLPV